MKWTIRFLSLLLALFFLSLWLFNEDVRSQPAPAAVFQALLTAVLLAAWRWEKAAGRLAMIGGLIFFLILIGGALLADNRSLTTALLGSVLLATPYVALGWLFFNLGRRAAQEVAGRTEG